MKMWHVNDLFENSKLLDAVLNAMLRSYINYVTTVRHCKVNKPPLLNTTPSVIRTEPLLHVRMWTFNKLFIILRELKKIENLYLQRMLKESAILLGVLRISYLTS